MTNSPHPSPPLAGQPSGATAPDDKPIVGTGLAAGFSTLVTIGAIIGLIVPSLNPWSDPSNSTLSGLVGHTVVTAVAALISIVSLLAGLAARLSPWHRGVRRWIAVVALINAIGLGVVAQGIGGLMLAGYAVALLLPIAVVALGVLAFRSYPRARPWLLLGAIVLIVGFVLLRQFCLALVGRVLVAFMGEVPDVITAVITLGCALSWGGVLARNYGRDARPLLAWAARHRIVLTVLAALGPLPYILDRITWLTPWPLLAPEDLPNDVRIWGLLLAAGGVVGSVLTLGLIRPWGERLPRWMPLVGGRPVPPAAAIAPGAVVAVLITAGAVPLLVAGVTSGEILLGIVFLPLWYWGPMLGLAVLAYAGHRAGLDRGTRSTGAAEPSTMNQ